MFKAIFYHKLKSEKWGWSWNGGIPYYLIEILFLEPTKEYMENLRHLKKYCLITSNYGKNISAYIVKQEHSKEKCDLYFRKNIQQYIDNYRILINSTNNLLSSYKDCFRDNKPKNVNHKELKILAELLIENIKLYLISQPEVTFVLEDALFNELNKKGLSQGQKKKILEMLQPEETILNLKDADLKNLFEKIRNKENINKLDAEKEIFDFYWKYRSFFMEDLDANIKDELNILKNTLQKQRKHKKRKKNQKEEYKLSEKANKIINYIKEIGALRLEGKNAWVNLVLLIINLLHNLSKQINIPIGILEKYSFSEIELLLKNGKRVKEFGKRENSVFIVSDNKINSYHGENGLKVRRIIKGKLEKTNSVKGNAAYHGNVKGTAFIITIQDRLSDKIEEISKIKDPILIAEQTAPSYLPLIEKAKGIITNEGGILSHAAIISREYKIPALIGTKIATQIFNQGDKITLDTEKGVAKFVSKTKGDIAAEPERSMQ